MIYRTLGVDYPGYQILKNSSSDSYFLAMCDMKLEIDDPNLETVIGPVSTKLPEERIFFQATRTNQVGTGDVTFTSIVINKGSGMKANGVFTVPKSGKYFFWIDGTVQSYRTYLTIRKSRHGNNVDLITFYDYSTNSYKRGFFRSYSTSLLEGDQIWLYVSNGYFYSDSLFSFSGTLLPDL